MIALVEPFQQLQRQETILSSSRRLSTVYIYIFLYMKIYLYITPYSWIDEHPLKENSNRSLSDSQVMEPSSFCPTEAYQTKSQSFYDLNRFRAIHLHYQDYQIYV